MTDVRQFGDRTAHSLDCARCEAMLADAVDGMLPAEDQEFFDAHIADCGPCEQLLAQAQRGAAWLEMLRSPAPEPPPALLEKILAQTSGHPASTLHPAPLAHPTPAMAPGYAGSSHGSVLPFPRRATAAMRAGAFGRIVFEPRLAMTAAMAFLSIALTMDLMGVNPMDLRAHDLSPSGLHRTFAQLNAHAVQYYEGLRVVYELESRVRDFQNVQDSAQDAPAQNQNQAPASVTDQAQPSGDNPADQTDDPAQQDQEKAAPRNAPAQTQPDSNAPSQHKSRLNTDSVSRREPAQPKGALAAFHRYQTSVSRPAVSDAALDDAVQEYLGGMSSMAYTAPLQDPAYAQRRAA